MPVKDNQETLHNDIRNVFKPLPSEKTITDQTLKKIHDDLSEHYDTCETIEKGHGWIEVRTMTTSTALSDYVRWPGLAQVYEYKTERTHTKTGEKRCHRQYGITSLTPQCASAAHLMKLRRGIGQ